MFDFLSAKQPIEQSFLRIPRISGVICGFWPAQQRNWWTVLRFVVTSFSVSVGTFGTIINGFVTLNDLTDALEAFCAGTQGLLSLIKMSTFFVTYKQLHVIVSQLRHMIVTDISPAKRRIMTPLAYKAGLLGFMLLSFGTSTNVCYNLRPLILMAYNVTHGHEVVNLMPFNVILPKIFYNYPLYPLTYCILTICGESTVFAFSAVDGFFLCLCMYACGLFRMLQNDIHLVFAELQWSDEMSSVAQNVKFRRNLARIVERHNMIMDLCSKFTSKFKLIILFQFLSAAVILCLSILNLMLMFPSIGAITYIAFSLGASTQLIFYCIGGDYVSKSSVEVAATLYDIEWCKCDVETRKMILMMLRRSQKAQTISVPFFTPSLVALSSIISTAGSYITMMKTFL